MHFMFRNQPKNAATSKRKKEYEESTRKKRLVEKEKRQNYERVEYTTSQQELSVRKMGEVAVENKVSYAKVAGDLLDNFNFLGEKGYF